MNSSPHHGRNRAVLAFVALGLLVGGTACSTTAPSSSASPAAKTGSSSAQKTLAFVNPASANSYQITFQCGLLHDAAQEGSRRAGHRPD
jgi:ABC-type sugar transport system substrate-binding protein